MKRDIGLANRLLYGEDGSPISLVPTYNDLRARGITPTAATTSTPSAPPAIGMVICAKPP